MEKTNKIQDDLQLIMNTIQSLDIKADYDTMNKLLGCLQMLGKMRMEAANWLDLKAASESSKTIKMEDSLEEVIPSTPNDDADVSEIPEMIPQ